MPITRPYRRNIRIFGDGSFSEGGRSKYIVHDKYAKSPEQYIRAYLLIQKDLFTLFDYVEPSDKNLPTYSYRIHELLLRTCVEIEANFKAILKENGYLKEGDWNMQDYKKVNPTHKLSSYEVKLPLWTGKKSIVKPFENWNKNESLKWYQAYNETKHNRHIEFEQAKFENLIKAIAGLVILLSSQFYTYDFSPGNGYLIISDGPGDGTESAIGDYFRVKFPTDWDEDERYEFNWQELKNEPDPFQNYGY